MPDTATQALSIAVSAGTVSVGATQAVPVTQSAAASKLGGSTTAAQTITTTQSATATAASSGPFVQETSGHTTGTSLTLAFSNPTTIGNAVIIACAGYYGGVISGTKLGDGADTFTKPATSGGYNAEIWICGQISESTTSLVLDTTEAGIIAYAYEVAGGAGQGYISPDQAAGDNATTGSSWSSGTTGETVNYTGQEFCIGLGVIVGNSGSITGPASGGWTNETAITDVVGADSLAIGAVSGYQVIDSQETLTYAGTSGSSGKWAAVTASFLIMERQPAWGGYVANTTADDPFTSISATFTVPDLSSASGQVLSMWVGIGNVEQTGIYCFYDTSSPGNNSCSSWTEFWPGQNNEAWDTSAFPIAAGDVVTFSMSYDGTVWTITQANSTQDWTYSEVKSIQAVAIVTGAWLYPLTTCEVIIEYEGSLPDYGTVAFTDITAVPSVADGDWIPLVTVNETIDQVPGPVSGASFEMHWVADT